MELHTLCRALTNERDEAKLAAPSCRVVQRGHMISLMLFPLLIHSLALLTTAAISFFSLTLKEEFSATSTYCILQYMLEKANVDLS